MPWLAGAFGRAHGPSTGRDPLRELDRGAAKALPPGSAHYTAYVGPPEQFDFMGATQFRLLTTLGLREHHTLLDFGCGSLRAGRLFIPYLAPGHYHGVDPNKWLIEDAIAQEVGADMISLKRPVFRHDGDFNAAHFGVRFDFIVAQSIFSHAGPDIVADSLRGFKQSLADGGLILATFIPPEILGIGEQTEKGWVYPDCVAYRDFTILAMIEAAGLTGRRLPWYHPRQTWYAIAHTREALPAEHDDIHLSGRVLRAPDFQG